jgi:hypothetical protein
VGWKIIPLKSSNTPGAAEDAHRGGQWQLNDALSGESFKRSGDEMLSTGLFVDLQLWGFHFLRFTQGDYYGESSSRSGSGRYLSSLAADLDR